MPTTVIYFDKHFRIYREFIRESEFFALQRTCHRVTGCLRINRTLIEFRARNAAPNRRSFTSTPSEWKQTYIYPPTTAMDFSNNPASSNWKLLQLVGIKERAGIIRCKVHLFSLRRVPPVRFSFSCGFTKCAYKYVDFCSGGTAWIIVS